MLRQFIAEAHAHEFGCVRIIHGKGQRGSNEWPVLKNLVDRMLRQRARDQQAADPDAKAAADQAKAELKSSIARRLAAAEEQIDAADLCPADAPASLEIDKDALFAEALRDAGASRP